MAKEDISGLALGHDGAARGSTPDLRPNHLMACTCCCPPGVQASKAVRALAAIKLTFMVGVIQVQALAVTPE